MVSGKPFSWVVQIQANGQRRSTVCHGTLAEAAAIYAQFANELHGDFARAE
jgi:hypothetical protein